MTDEMPTQFQADVIDFPLKHLTFIGSEHIDPQTPLVNQMEERSKKLDALSSYKSKFDWESMRSLERRVNKNPIRGGLVFKSPFRLVNSHSTCQQCLYAFEVDTYGRGCVHNCVYCYAKAELTVHGMWNQPYPVPADPNELRKVFYTVFETDRSSKWREIMMKRIPIRIGSMSDSFMRMDERLGVTKEFLRILDFYSYPFVIFTRSDLIAQDEYLKLIRRDLASIQFSISSTNDKLNRQIEPGAPSAKRRLAAINRISNEGYWTTVRINPVFPIYPDGYFSNPSFEWNGTIPKFEFFDFNMVDEIAGSGVKSVLAGFGRFSSFSINQIQKATGFDLRVLYKQHSQKSKRDHHFSDREIRYYYEEIQKRCQEYGVQFTTCYIGNGDEHFWKDQDLWSNKKDCCNIKGRVSAFKTDSREIDFKERIRLSGSKLAVPVDPSRLHVALGNKIQTGRARDQEINQ